MQRVGIIGSGFGGLCMGIQLKQAGIEDFTIFERADSVGGTWRANTYPGAECDIPTSLYSYSFERYDWPCKWSHQQVIRDYLEHCTDAYGLRPHLRLGTTVVRAEFKERSGDWIVTCDDGSIHAFDVLVSATGQLSRPKIPEIAGQRRFEGVSFHSAEWDHGHDLRGRHVAVIGSGASAAQFVPEIAKDADKVTIFQRTPNWMVPKRDREYTDWQKTLARRIPLLAKSRRARVWLQSDILAFELMRKESRLRPLATKGALTYLRTISDPDKRRALTPDYPMGAKRILFTDTFYEAVEEHDVDIVTTPITSITPTGVRCADGTTHDADTIIYGTGFHTNDFLTPMRVTGRGGRSLADEWSDGAEAYLGITASGFPNLFFLYGPNTNLGHTSIVLMLEAQVRYVLSALDQLSATGIDWIDVRPEVQRRYNDELQARLAETAWTTIEDSWYLQNGKVTNNWPGRTTEYRRRTNRCDLTDYAVKRAKAAR